ncbi:hypothetical protein scyTo_0004199 [Scyliorhinus torazame]|uniref:Uncharacterized protein n=1 Tax=Scyliorhinus torazame TaxID=75743 RepID=A0A401NMJ9_SCYTO|nr:hypothetical protein [Scyliorhinus torazame]
MYTSLKKAPSKRKTLKQTKHWNSVEDPIGIGLGTPMFTQLQNCTDPFQRKRQTLSESEDADCHSREVSSSRLGRLGAYSLLQIRLDEMLCHGNYRKYD